MNRVIVLLLASVVTFCFLHRPAQAQGVPWQQKQIAAGNVNQAQMAGAAQVQSGQLARMMITAYDKDGDEALNAVELQAGLMELLLRISATFGQMQQLGNQGIQQQAAGFQGGAPEAFGRGQRAPMGKPRGRR